MDNKGLKPEELKLVESVIEENKEIIADMEHPELNASAIARRMGISQSLFAQYISGIKKPSEKRLNEILSTMQEVGKELMTIKTDIKIKESEYSMETV